MGHWLLAVAMGMLGLVLWLLLVRQPDFLTNPEAVGTNAVLLGIPLLLAYTALHMVLWRNPRFSQTHIFYQPASLNPSSRLRAISLSDIVEVRCKRLKGALGVVVVTKDAGRHEFRAGNVEGATQQFLEGASAKSGFKLTLPDEPVAAARNS